MSDLPFAAMVLLNGICISLNPKAGTFGTMKALSVMIHALRSGHALRHGRVLRNGDVVSKRVRVTVVCGPSHFAKMRTVCRLDEVELDCRAAVSATFVGASSTSWCPMHNCNRA